MSANDVSAPGVAGERRSLRVLVVEDSEPDVLLMLQLLKRGGFATQHGISSWQTIPCRSSARSRLSNLVKNIGLRVAIMNGVKPMPRDAESVQPRLDTDSRG
jgi:hypothetical protein